MLSKEQEAVVQHINGQVLCIACPGSGKTTVIVERIKQMLDEGIAGEHILVITFTKEAAMQMQSRFEEKYGKEKVFFGTIHSVCFQVLKKAYHLTKENILLDSEQWIFFSNLLRNTVVRREKAKIDNFQEYIKNMIGEISYIRNKGISYKKYKPEYSDKEVFIHCFEEYKEYKKINHKIDFDDMLWLCYDAFQRYPQELRFWQERFQYIMIDEYQDTNRLQAEIFYALAGADGNLCVVGDDDQSCYRFRGADSKVFLEFPKKYPNTATYHLSTNYRSGKKIIDHAGRLIQKNHDRFEKKFLWNREDDGEVTAVCHKVGDELHLVLEQIKSLHKNGTDYKDISVLYRVNLQNQLLIGELLKEKIPFYCTEPPRDYHKEFIFCDILAYYRLANGMERTGDLQQILNRPQRYLKSEAFKKCRFNKNDLLSVCENFESHKRSQCMKRVFELLSDVKTLRDKSPAAFVEYLYTIMGYDDFSLNFAMWCGKDVEYIKTLMKNLKQESTKFKTMEEWVAYADFYAEELEKNRKCKKKEGICLSTLHSAKGLEWKNVIILDGVEGVYPYQKAELPEDYEEERRLFYVGLTRAKDSCTIYYSKKNPSRYLYDMELLKII